MKDNEKQNYCTQLQTKINALEESEGVPNTKYQTNHQPQNFRQLLVLRKIKVFSKLNTLDLSLVIYFK